MILVFISLVENLSSGFPTRTATKHAVQPALETSITETRWLETLDTANQLKPEIQVYTI